MMLPFIKPYSFEWDEEKNKANQRKHGVSFEDAQYAFTDPNMCVMIDDDHTNETEIRYFCLGMIHSKVCTVRFVMRNKRIRIIGAGYWRKEKARYEKENRR